jgi:putative nucleotidyltransferase with HDIG domain
MRFSTRTFWFTFIPLALLLLSSFWSIQNLTQDTVRKSLRESLKETHALLAAANEQREQQNSRFLRVVAENATLKAGIELVRVEKSPEARRTLEEQLEEICDSLHLDVMTVADPNGRALAGVMRVDRQLVALDMSRADSPAQGLWDTGGRLYRMTAIPVNLGEENLGALALGERLDLGEFAAPVVLTRDNAQRSRVVAASLPGFGAAEIEEALRNCPAHQECDVRLGGQTYMSLPLSNLSFGDGYLLRSLQNVDAANAPVRAILRDVFLAASIGALLAASILSFLSSRSITRPISNVIARLRESEATGLLPEFPVEPGQVLEIRALTESFDRAGVSIREGRSRLHQAYVDFVGSMASALDARDRYTAGHSRRVSEYSEATARALGMSAQEIDDIRIGALLHDIGKIGIADSVLQKPGRLSAEEVALIRQHPTIGRRILQEIHGFERYLPIVELHHENWDGTGYPLGLHGWETPQNARIVHVVDAFDAMTTDRPYRPGMSQREAVAIPRKYAGTQFDMAAVTAFTELVESGAAYRTLTPPPELEMQSVANLAEALRNPRPPAELAGPILVPSGVARATRDSTNDSAHDSTLDSAHASAHNPAHDSARSAAHTMETL